MSFKSSSLELVHFGNVYIHLKTYWGAIRARDTENGQWTMDWRGWGHNPYGHANIYIFIFEEKQKQDKAFEFAFKWIQ